MRVSEWGSPTKIHKELSRGCWAYSSGFLFCLFLLSFFPSFLLSFFLSSLLFSRAQRVPRVGPEAAPLEAALRDSGDRLSGHLPGGFLGFTFHGGWGGGRGGGREQGPK